MARLINTKWPCWNAAGYSDGFDARTPSEFKELYGFPYTDFPQYFTLGKSGRVHTTSLFRTDYKAIVRNTARNFAALGV